jgi:hypothetical protein
MNHALYAHINNKRKMKKKRINLEGNTHAQEKNKK